jgi:hypothetical protein
MKIEGAIITEPLEHPEPGIYIASATHPAYGWLKALTVTGAARFIGERYEVDGTKMLAAEILGHALTPNAHKVKFRQGKAHFSAAMKEYRDWKEAWWREAIQNAVDAGATQIDCRVEQIEEGIAVSCSDNGRGMDAWTIENKFMVSIESTKEGVSGAAGGFGKAKELLILPWIAWSIHSLGTRVYGSGDDGEGDDAPYRQGTELRVIMPADNASTADAAIEYIRKCTLPHVTFTVNGQVVAADLDRGEEIRDFHGKAVLYHSRKEPKLWKALVRTKGLAMFSFGWMPSGLEGHLVIETVGPSVDLLTSNRDGFRDEGLRDDLDQFIRQLSADLEVALEKKKNHFDLRFEGSGKFEGAPQAELQAAMLSHLEEIVPARQKGGQIGTLSASQITVLTEILGAMGGGAAEDEAQQGGALNMRATAAVATALLDGVPMSGTDAVEAAIKQLSWEPDFFMSNKVDGFQPPKMFFPKTMTPTLRKLAKMWAELCRFVLIQLGSKQQFGVGWMFAERTGAAYQHLPDQDEHWLLFNPFKRPRSFDYTGKPSKDDLYNPSDDEDLAWLYASAIHECTHMADGFDEHDVAFAYAFTRNVAKIAGKEKQIRAIRKAVLARGPKAPGAAPREKKAPAFAPLADASLEKARVGNAWKSGGTRGAWGYVLFTSTNTFPSEHSSSEATLKYTVLHDDLRGAEIRKAGGKVVWRAADFNLPLVEKRERGKKGDALAPLADKRLEQERRRLTTGSGYRYSMFAGDSVYDVYDTDDLTSEALERGRGLRNVEWRDKEADGAPAWRSKDFSLPLAGASGGELPELADSWISSDRQNKARELEARNRYAAFRNTGNSLWTYGADLAEMKRELEADVASDSYSQYEIRDQRTGKPVWRSANFDLDLVEHVANRAFQGMELSVASMEPDEFALGVEHELEQTGDQSLAEQIALDNLTEDPHYYSRLAGGGGMYANQEEEEGPHSWKPNAANPIGAMTLREALDGLHDLDDAYEARSRSAISGTGSGFRKASYRRNREKYLARIRELEPRHWILR